MVGWSGDPGASLELWGSPSPITKFGMGVVWGVRKQGGDARESHRLLGIGREPSPAGREDTPMVTQRAGGGGRLWEARGKGGLWLH